MLIHRWAWKNILRHPIQTGISVLLCVFCFTVAGLFTFVDSLTPIALMKAYYYAPNPDHDTGFSKLSYMQFRYSSRTGISGQIPYEATQELCEELHALGQGFSVDYAWDDWQYVDGREQEEGPGLYNVEDFIAKTDGDAKDYVHAPGKYGAWSDFNEEGEFAPYYAGQWDGVFSSKYLYRPQAYHAMYRNFSLFYDMDEASMEAYGYKLYGKFPEETDEIVLPWYLYMTFHSYGYRNGVNGEKEEIGSPEDMIGKELLFTPVGRVKVVGILQAEEDIFKYIYGAVSDDTGNYGTLSALYVPLFSVIVSEECFRRANPPEQYCTGVTVLKNSSAELQEAYFDIGTRFMQDMSWSEILNDKVLHVNCNVGLGLQGTNSLQVTTILQMKSFLILFVPLSVLLSAFLFVQTMKRGEKQIMLLRSLGAGKRKILISYIAPIAVLLLLILLLSVGLTIIGSRYLFYTGYQEWLTQFHIEMPAVYYRGINLESGLLLFGCGLSALAITGAALLCFLGKLNFAGGKKEEKSEKRQSSV